MTTERISLRLSGLRTPSGEIALTDLASLASALQTLATRIARDLNDERGPGRSTGAVDRVAQLRLAALTAGSTTLELYGGEDTLDVDLALESMAFDRLWEIFEGLATANRPEWVSHAIAESALGLAQSLGVATALDVSGGRRDAPRRPVRMVTTRIDRSTWNVQAVRQRRSNMSVSGVLEMVDLRSRRFRIRDDVGNDIALDDVSNPRAAAGKAGRRVSALGEAEYNARGQIVKVYGAEIVSSSLPAEWTLAGRAQTDAAAIQTAFEMSVPVGGGVADLTDDELEEFLAAIR